MGPNYSLVFVVWLAVWALPTWLCQCNGSVDVDVDVIVKGDGDAEAAEGSNARNLNWDLNGMQCVCDGECEWLGEGASCPWGVTLDFCGCCLLCSRGQGEPCGGAVGTCAKGLVCHNKGLHSSEGTCSKIGDEKLCEDPWVEFGCLFHDGDCVCEQHRICPHTQIFLFANEQACRSRIILLTKTQKSQRHSLSTSVSPNNSNIKSNHFNSSRTHSPSQNKERKDVPV